MAHIRNILVPVDGSPPSIAALDEAVTLADEIGATVVVLDMSRALDAAAEAAREQAAEEMHDAINLARSRLSQRMRVVAESGEPVRAILEAAAAERVDLLVIGTHGRSGRLHALVGSVAESVVRNAPCPVLTVRHAEGDDQSFAERIHRRPPIADQVRSSR
ncbi:MAG TPA: universal stress protein [Minicystis sp.]|nr:universal stress protein [Minicystis sp.]